MKEISKLVTDAVGGDKKALEELYLISQKSVYFTCLSFVKNENDAKDMTHDTYMTAFSKLSSLKEPESFEAWVNRIAVNTCKNFLARRKDISLDDENADVCNSVVDENFLPEEYVTDIEKRRVIMRIIRDSLSEVQYRTVIMFYFNEMSIREIAQSMDCPEGTVKFRLNAARAKIKESVLDYEEKNDEKLHSIAGIPFLTRLLRAEADSIDVPQIRIGFDFPSGGSVRPDTAAKNLASNGGKRMLGTLKAKVIAGAAAAVIVGGGVAAGVALSADNDSDDEPVTVYENHVIRDNSEQAESLYIEKDSNTYANEDSSEDSSSRQSSVPTDYPQFEGLEPVELQIALEGLELGDDEISGHIVSMYHQHNYDDNYWVFLDDKGVIYEYERSIGYKVKELASDTGMSSIENMFWGQGGWESGFGEYSCCMVIVEGQNMYMKLFDNDDPNHFKEIRSVIMEGKEVAQIQIDQYSGQTIQILDAEGNYIEALFDSREYDNEKRYLDSEETYYILSSYYEEELADREKTKKIAGEFSLMEDGSVYISEDMTLNAVDIYPAEPYNNNTSRAILLTEDNKIRRVDKDYETILFDFDAPDNIENLWATGDRIIIKAADGYYSCIPSEEDEFTRFETLDNVADMIVSISEEYVLLSNGYLYEIL